jgi:hypothetical protein
VDNTIINHLGKVYPTLKNGEAWGMVNMALFYPHHPLVNVYITMENHHFSWENSLFLWPFSIAMLNYQRVSPYIPMFSP